MKIEQVKEIANAVLYEGYLLYPYRHSAIKNRQRWTIGVVYPQEYSEANDSIEPWMMQTECLVSGSADTSLDIYMRFLHLLLRRTVQSATANVPSETELDTMNASEWSLASRLASEPWEEGTEREVSVLNLPLSSLLDHPRHVEIEFSGERMVEESTGESSATIIREQQPLAGTIIINAEPMGTNLFKLNVQIENRTPGTGALTGNAVMLHSFVSTHTILQVRQGTFVSLMDPPETLKTIAQGCQNLRTWPVLAGNEGDSDTMLSSPIILYDYPQIAPESPGSLFDGTEIDEILTLRIMTLTDEEKQEMRQGDERAREILERTESLTPEQFMKLHGVIRSLRPVDEGGAGGEASLPGSGVSPDTPQLIDNGGAGGEASLPGSGVSPDTPLLHPPQAASEREENMSNMDRDFPGEDYPPPASVLIAGKEVKAGDRVRLHPKARADAFDMLLDGRTARVEIIHQDFENRIYLVVTLDDDPGREQWDERILPGHRFYFFPEEVEPLEEISLEDLEIPWRKPWKGQ